MRQATHSALSLKLMQRPVQRAVQLALIGLACSAAALHVTPLRAETATTEAAKRQYDIQAGPLGSVLSRFAASAGIVLSFDAALTSGKQSDGLHGSYTPTGGLAHLLSGHRLEAVRGQDGIYLLRVLPAASSAVLPEVRVTANVQEDAWGAVQGYSARRTATATKTSTSLSETPQSITVITKDQITDTGALTLDQALTYAAGVRTGIWGVSTRLDAPQMRGGEPTLYLDGLNDNVQYWTSTVRVEPYLLERIEVLRGPSSMLYGQGTTVGVVNSVSKKPLAEKYNEVGVRVGSYGLKQTQLDSTGPLTEDGKWLYRIVAVLKESETQIDFSRDDRQLIAPSLTWKPDADTEWTFRMKWQKDRAGGDTGNALPWEGTILSNPNGRISRHTFVGEKQADRFNADNIQLGWSLSHQLNEQWQFRQNLRWTDNKNDYAAMDAYAPYLDADQRLLHRAAYYWKQNTRTFNADQMLEGVFKAGATEHRVLIGLDLLDYSQQSRDSGDDSSTPGSALTPVDVYNPVYNSAYRIPAYVQGPKNGIKQVGIYVQDQIRYNNWIVVAGLRHDESENWENGSADRNDSANTKRLGAMYKFSNGLVPYLSYSESFQPQANLPTGQKANPLQGEQWEAGFKFEPVNSMWRGNVAVFDLREKNRIVQTGVFDFSQKGETKNTGFEAELIGRITRNIDINANYTLTNVDKQLTALPKHRAAVWSTYRFSVGNMPGFSVGGGVQYAGNFTDGAGTPTTPSVTLLDAMLAWESTKWRVALNVSNLTDKEYFTNCWSWGTCSYGMGRYGVLSASYRF